MSQIFRLCILKLALAAGSAGAAPLGQGWTPVGADVLDSARGGFSFGPGLAVTFGLERLVSLNGEVVARTSVQLPDLRQISFDQARQARDALSSVKLIQNGNGNIYQPTGQMLGATVIQNSLNDQVIRTQTVINASVNSLALLQALRLERSLVEALAGSASPH